MTITQPPADVATPVPDPAPAAPPRLPWRRDTYTLALSAVIFGLFALAASIFAVALAGQAVSEARQKANSPATATPAAPATTATLREFAIDPGSFNLSAGAVLKVMNSGTIAHNLSVDGIASPMLQKGQSTELNLSSLKPGQYTMRCDVPGHEAAGMNGTITIK